MATWTRKPQETEGKYFFSGKFLATAGVSNELSEVEIFSIYKNVQAFVKEQNGIDYLQVFEDENGRRLFFIDQLNQSMIASGEYEPEHNHCTLLFDHEY